MPTSEEHLKKYEQNKLLLENFISKKYEPNYEWMTTICFYTSLHIIESYFAKEQKIDNKTHLQREENMLKIDGFRKITDAYK